MGPDFTELMDGSQARNDSVVSDLNMTGEGSVVGENNFISDLTIMRDVRVGEAKIIGANSSWGILFSSPVYSRVFAKDVTVPYDERGGFAGIFEVLGFDADCSEGKKFVFVANLTVAVNDDVRMELTSLAKSDICFNNTVGAYFGFGSDFCVGGDNSGGMNHADY